MSVYAPRGVERVLVGTGLPGVMICKAFTYTCIKHFSAHVGEENTM